MTAYLQMLMIIALQTEKARNSLFMSDLPPPPPKSLIIKQLRVLFRSCMMDIQYVNINRLLLLCLETGKKEREHGEMEKI
ncbi:MAG: hypothetical protein LBT04_04240 [Prevotellaceae bacterium]|jgi:hypothetical protein|nr:hypothetical protein [Prevotellaceae bacterium]